MKIVVDLENTQLLIVVFVAVVGSSLIEALLGGGGVWMSHWMSNLVMSPFDKVVLLLSELCLIIRTKTATTDPYTVVGMTRMAEKSVKKVVYLLFLFYFFKY